MHSRTARFLIVLSIVAVGVSATVFAINQRTVVGVQPDGRILVPNGQTLTPAGTHIEVNERPLGMVVSPNGSLARRPHLRPPDVGPGHEYRGHRRDRESSSARAGAATAEPG